MTNFIKYLYVMIWILVVDGQSRYGELVSGLSRSGGHKDTIIISLSQKQNIGYKFYPFNEHTNNYNDDDGGTTLSKIIRNVQNNIFRSIPNQYIDVPNADDYVNQPNIHDHMQQPSIYDYWFTIPGLRSFMNLHNNFQISSYNKLTTLPYDATINQIPQLVPVTTTKTHTKEVRYTTKRPQQPDFRKTQETIADQSPKIITVLQQRKPQESSSTRPEETITTRPQETSTTRPQKNTIIRPQETATTRPQKTITTRPQEYTTTRPRKTITTRPKDYTTTRTKETTTTRPQETTTSRPQENSTKQYLDDEDDSTRPITLKTNSAKNNKVLVRKIVLPESVLPEVEHGSVQAGITL